MIAAMSAPVARQRLHVTDGVARQIQSVAALLAAEAGFLGQTRWLHRGADQTQSDDRVVLEPAGLDALGLLPRVDLAAGLAGVITDLRARLAVAAS